LAGLVDLPRVAVTRYTELLRQMAGAFPEVALWMFSREHRATRESVRQSLTPSLRDLLAAISSDRAPDARLTALSTAYGAWLERPMVPLDELAQGMQVPTLADAYRVSSASANRGSCASTASA
jgi:hypothetical protein